MNIKKITNTIKMRMGVISTVDVAKSMGVKIGDRCKILSNPYHTFGSEPYLISIGNHVEITSGVQFITHDGGAWIVRDDNNCGNVDVFGKIIIEDNVFIGLNTIIMPNVHIGNSVCIAAGSIVTKDIPSGEVWGGGPAKFIKPYKEYKAGILKKCDYTKNLSTEEKKEKLKEKHKEWFK